MASKGTLEVRIVGDSKPFKRALNDVGGRLQSFAGAAAKALAVAIPAATGAAVVGLAKIGQTFDEAYDTIRVGTGATGEALEGLQDSLKAVAREVPASIGDVGIAIADLNTRTGATGETLEDLAARTLELSRLAGSDLQETIAGTTRVFGDWAIAVEDQAGTLDMLFRAAQGSGITIEELTTAVVDSGAPLRQMGFRFEESIALLAKFEKEGVNTRAILGGLKIALGKMAQAGEEPIETFQRLSEEIAAAATAGEANAIAVEAFGTRAGPDLAAAIREGRFELADYLDMIENGSDTILQAAEDTESFTEKWQQFKNRVLVALEPVANRTFEALGSLMDWLGDQWEKHGPRVTEVVTNIVETAAEKFADVKTAVVDWWDTVKPRLEEFVTAIRHNWPNVQDILEASGEVIKAVGRIFSTEFGNMADDAKASDYTIEQAVTDIMSAVATMAKMIAAAVGAISMSWNLLSGVATLNAQKILRAVNDLTGGGLQRFVEAFPRAFQKVAREVAVIANRIIDSIETTINALIQAAREAAKVALPFGAGNLIPDPPTVNLPNVPLPSAPPEPEVPGGLRNPARLTASQSTTVNQTNYFYGVQDGRDAAAEFHKHALLSA